MVQMALANSHPDLSVDRDIFHEENINGWLDAMT
jgi:hypothetical protein